MSDNESNKNYLWLIPLYLVLQPKASEDPEDRGGCGCLLLIVLAVCCLCCLSWLVPPA